MQECYYYQIFLDQKHNLLLPSVQQLLEHSFHSEGIKLAEVSFCFKHECPAGLGAPVAAGGTAAGSPKLPDVAFDPQRRVSVCVPQVLCEEIQGN